MIITNEIREIWGEASRAGITKDSIGQELNVAERAARKCDTEMEIRHLKRAIEIHNTWGARLPSSYAMSAETLKRTTDRLEELTPAPEPEPQAAKSPAQVGDARAEKYAHLIGSVVPAGHYKPQWLFVTKVDGDTIWGRKWSARSQRWTKCATWFTRDALYKMTPRCTKPPRPADAAK